MRQIEKLNKYTLDIIESKLQEALQVAATELGLSIKVNGCRYQDQNCTFKVDIALIREDGTVADPIVDDFNRYCQNYGLDREDFGKMFSSGEGRFEIIGLKPRNHRYPIIGKRADGKRFKFPASTVQMGLTI